MIPTWTMRNDYVLCMCRKLVEKDLGTRAGNSKSFVYPFDKFMKERDKKDNFDDFIDVRKAFFRWIKKLVKKNISDEHVAILVRKYEQLMFSWEKRGKNTATELKNAWIEFVAERIIDLANDYGINLYTMCGV